MKFTNLEIYNILQAINAVFTGKESFPIKINFYLQKNIRTLQTAVQEIDVHRLAIGEKYGTATENGYTISPENMDDAQKEYSELMNIEQELPICTIKFTDLPEDLSITMEQMEALQFMIVEEEENA